MNFVHGRTGTPEYRAWKGMIQQCTNPNTRQWKDYGGRGVRVCDEWRDFERFRADMGSKPSSKHTLERVNNDLSYEPGNVVWATRLAQNNNTRRNRFIEVHGETLTLTGWSRKTQIPIATLFRRLERNPKFLDHLVEGL
jgi:hypothetical protein